MYNKLNTNYSDNLSEQLFRQKINNVSLNNIISIHNAAFKNLRKDDDAITSENTSDNNEDLKPFFHEFAFELHQEIINKVHKYAIERFENSANPEKTIYAILAIETSVYLVDGISEKELRKIKAKYGQIKNFCKQSIESILI